MVVVFILSSRLTAAAALGSSNFRSSKDRAKYWGKERGQIGAVRGGKGSKPV